MAATATTYSNKKRCAGQALADVDHTGKEVVSELKYWAETLTKWLALNRARTLGSVVDLSMLSPNWRAIAGLQVSMLSVDVVLRLMEMIYKDKGPPMSFDVRQSLRAIYSTICLYARVLSSVTASDTISSAAAAATEAATAAAAAAATEAATAAAAAKKAKDDERYSRVVLLRSIARKLVPGVVQGDVELVLEGEQLRRVDRAFLAWPVRYATPSSICYTPADEGDDSPASIGFWWDSGSLIHVEMVSFDIYCDDDDDSFEFVAQDEKEQAVLERVDNSEE